jgi:hypothetical protein
VAFAANLVLDHVPVLGKHAILDAYDVGEDPVPRLPEAGHSPVQDDEIAFGDDNAATII